MYVFIQISKAFEPCFHLIDETYLNIAAVMNEGLCNAMHCNTPLDYVCNVEKLLLFE